MNFGSLIKQGNTRPVDNIGSSEDSINVLEEGEIRYKSIKDLSFKCDKHPDDK